MLQICCITRHRKGLSIIISVLCLVLASFILRSNLARSLELWSGKRSDLIPLERAESKLLFSERGEMAGLDSWRLRLVWR